MSSKMTQIQVRIDIVTKKAAREVLEKLGLDLSTAIKMFCRQIQITGTLPMQIRDINGFTPEKAQEFREAVIDAHRSTKTYYSAKKVIEDIEA